MVRRRDSRMPKGPAASQKHVVAPDPPTTETGADLTQGEAGVHNEGNETADTTKDKDTTADTGPSKTTGGGKKAK